MYNPFSKYDEPNEVTPVNISITAATPPELLQLVVDKKRSYNRMPKLFHISFDKDLPELLDSRLPDGTTYVDGEVEESYLPEPSIGRISFSDNLEGCFRAGFANLTEEMIKKGSKGITYQGYELLRYGGKHFTPAEIAPWVHDALVTQEHWIIGVAAVKRVSEVTFKYDLDQPDLPYKVYGTGETISHSPTIITHEVSKI